MRTTSTKMEEKMDASKFRYRKLYAKLYDLAREIDQDNKNDRNAGLMVDFNVAQRLVKGQKAKLAEQLDDATLFEKRLEEIKVTENDRESKKIKIRTILHQWNAKKRQIFASLRTTCAKHKTELIAWQKAKENAQALRKHARHLRREARRYKQEARAAMDSIRKAWPKLAQAVSSAATPL